MIGDYEITEHGIRLRHSRMRGTLLGVIVAIAAGPVVLWMIVSLLRTHVEPPKAPVYRALTMTVSDSDPAPGSRQATPPAIPGAAYALASAAPPAVAEPLPRSALPLAEAEPPMGSVFDRAFDRPKLATAPSAATDLSPTRPDMLATGRIPLPRPRLADASGQRIPTPRPRPSAADAADTEPQPTYSYQWDREAPQ
jgi:hypothetical protein